MKRLIVADQKVRSSFHLAAAQQHSESHAEGLHLRGRQLLRVSSGHLKARNVRLRCISGMTAFSTKPDAYRSKVVSHQLHQTLVRSKTANINKLDILRAMLDALCGAAPQQQRSATCPFSARHRKFVHRSVETCQQAPGLGRRMSHHPSSADCNILTEFSQAQTRVEKKVKPCT